MRVRIQSHQSGNAVNVLKDALTEALNQPVRRLVNINSTFSPRADDVILNYGFSGSLFEKERGYILLNTGEAVGRATNKAVFFTWLKSYNQRLTSNQRPIPLIESTTEASEARNWARNGNVVYARTVLQGHSGAGIEVTQPSADAVVPRAGLYTKGISGSRREYRIHVFNGQVILMQKKMRREGWRDNANYSETVRNLDGGWVFAISNVNPSAQVSNACIDTVNALGLDFGAVDIITTGSEGSESGVYVVEVNTAPGQGGESTTAAYVAAITAVVQGREVYAPYAGNNITPAAPAAASVSTGPVDTVGMSSAERSMLLSVNPSDLDLQECLLNVGLLLGFLEDGSAPIRHAYPLIYNLLKRIATLPRDAASTTSYMALYNSFVEMRAVRYENNSVTATALLTAARASVTAANHLREFGRVFDAQVNILACSLRHTRISMTPLQQEALNVMIAELPAPLLNIDAEGLDNTAAQRNPEPVEPIILSSVTRRAALDANVTDLNLQASLNTVEVLLAMMVSERTTSREAGFASDKASRILRRITEMARGVRSNERYNTLYDNYVGHRAKLRSEGSASATLLITTARSDITAANTLRSFLKVTNARIAVQACALRNERVQMTENQVIALNSLLANLPRRLVLIDEAGVETTVIPRTRPTTTPVVADPTRTPLSAAVSNNVSSQRSRTEGRPASVNNDPSLNAALQDDTSFIRSHYLVVMDGTRYLASRNSDSEEFYLVGFEVPMVASAFSQVSLINTVI